MDNLKRWFASYWRWTTGGSRWRWLPTAIVLFMLLAIAIPSGEKEKDEASSSAKAPAQAAANPTASAQIATIVAASPAPVPTSVPAPPTVPPPPTQPPAPTPLPPLEARLEKSYRDNRDFMRRATNDKLAVTWQPQEGVATFTVYGDEATDGGFLTVTAHSALVANRAVWTTYPEVQEIRLVVMSAFVDQFGAKKDDIAAMITTLRPTGMQFQYDGLKDRVTADNKSLFCVADNYRIHGAIYREINDKGCLARWGALKL